MFDRVWHLFAPTLQTEVPSELDWASRDGFGPFGSYLGSNFRQFPDPAKAATGQSPQDEPEGER